MGLLEFLLALLQLLTGYADVGVKPITAGRVEGTLALDRFWNLGQQFSGWLKETSF
jgi:hypothetical protein